MNILGISGSLRKDSLNTLLLHVAAGMVSDAGAKLTVFDLSKILFYNADQDGENKPGPVKEFISAIGQADGLLFVTPEYNYSIPGVLKNAIDWASRPGYQSILKNKPAGMLTASTSPVGGARAQIHLRDILAATLTPVYQAPDCLLPQAQHAFNEDGSLKDDQVKERLKRYVNGFIDWLGTMKNENA